MVDALKRIWFISVREWKRMVSRPLYVFCMIIAPIFCYVFFTTLMGEGLPNNMPVGVVDMDNTSTSRSIVRNLDAFQMTDIIAQYSNFDDARKAMQQGKIYAFYYIPRHTTEKALASRQPRVSFYTNNAFMIPGSLLWKEMRTMSELASGSVGRATLRAKGYTDKQAVAFLQPIAIDAHALNNPWLNYSVYLSNTILPGILMLLIFQMTIYSVGVEQKDDTVKKWFGYADNNIIIALTGKLLPQTFIFFMVTSLYDAYLYGFLNYPCNGGILPMMLASLLLVLASQAFGLFLYGALPSIRFAMSVASLWGVLSFSLSGFTFPCMAMHPTLQGLAYLFPLRHYFLIYVNQALNGYSMIYAWQSYLMLLVFLALPFFIIKRLKMELMNYKYMP